jgi:WD40 repeat protein
LRISNRPIILGVALVRQRLDQAAAPPPPRQPQPSGAIACIWGLAFSPDSRRLASAAGVYRSLKAPGEVKIWDAVTGQDLITLSGPTCGFFGVAFSPDGRRLATASQDGIVRIWDGTPLAETPAWAAPS